MRVLLNELPIDYDALVKKSSGWYKKKEKMSHEEPRPIDSKIANTITKIQSFSSERFKFKVTGNVLPSSLLKLNSVKI